MNTHAKMQEIIRFDRDWSKIKDANPETGDRFHVYLKNEHDEIIRIVFDNWRIEDVGIAPNKYIEHPFYIGDHIDQVKHKAFLKGWQIYTP